MHAPVQVSIRVGLSARTHKRVSVGLGARRKVWANVRVRVRVSVGVITCPLVVETPWASVRCSVLRPLFAQNTLSHVTTGFLGDGHMRFLAGLPVRPLDHHCRGWCGLGGLGLCVRGEPLDHHCRWESELG